MQNSFPHAITICKRCGTDTRRKEHISKIINTILFGKYELLSILGKGGTSTVYLAKHLTLKSYRAIKCIPRTKEPISSQCLEAELLKHLNHPGIPTLYDVDQDQEYYYIVEEYIQGESLDTFVSRQNYISQELIINFGIQLCDILIYLHQLNPYPVIYQDLKPEHIILCENQLKLIDFGIASFFTGSDKPFQFYGTKEFSAPEVQNGTCISPLSDLYSLGQVLLFLMHAGNSDCTQQLKHVINKACSYSMQDRYETVACFKIALEQVSSHTCFFRSHLYKKIIVLGCKHGIGTTHIAASLVNILNQNGYHSIYLEQNDSDSLRMFIRSNRSVYEKEGICYYKFFQGIPLYGSGVHVPPPSNALIVEDRGVYKDFDFQYNTDTLILFILGGELDMERTLLAGLQLKHWEHLVFICNYGNKSAARQYARMLDNKVYCFPADTSPFTNTTEKEQFFFNILQLKRRRHKWFSFIQKIKESILPSELPP